MESVVARPRPAVFFDRDGTINLNTHYPHKGEQLAFLPGAIDAVKRVNDLGYYAFLVTNQSGVARGYFTEPQVHAFHALIQRHLRAAGAHFDDIRYCPYLKGASVAEYDRDSDWRKPRPGMILDLIKHWPIDQKQSLVIGDQDSDMQAAVAANLRGVRYSGGRVDEVLMTHLYERAKLV
ncbi:MAG: HAD family hydrolase [Xanthobacteraceae bacterium]|nr:HAD family hydrolase [Xanthobacteraceae bacterium]